MRAIYVTLLFRLLYAGGLNAQSDSLKNQITIQYPYSLEVGLTWAKASDIGNGFRLSSKYNFNASIQISRSKLHFGLALQAGSLWNNVPQVAYSPVFVIYKRYNYCASPMLGWSFVLGNQSGREIGFRAGPEYRHRFDSALRYNAPWEPELKSTSYNELGARFEAYADLIRYKRVFLRGRIAYNLFSFSNSSKHPNQAEIMGTIGISLGKKR